MPLTLLAILYITIGITLLLISGKFICTLDLHKTKIFVFVNLDQQFSLQMVWVNSQLLFTLSSLLIGQSFYLLQLTITVLDLQFSLKMVWANLPLIYQLPVGS